MFLLEKDNEKTFKNANIFIPLFVFFSKEFPIHNVQCVIK